MAPPELLSAIAASFRAPNRKGLPNRAEVNGAAAAANQRLIKIDMITGMIEHHEAGLIAVCRVTSLN
jgi:hypothetical protein